MNTTRIQAAANDAHLVFFLRAIQGLDGQGGIALRKLAERVDRAWRFERLEFSQILTRYAVGIVITAYAIVEPALETRERDGSNSITLLLVAAWIIGFGLLAHLVIWPERYVFRRTASICADAVALSLLIHYGERSAAIFFPIYLWVILGNGFRFGIAYMYASVAANAICFVLMVLTTQYWREEWQFSAGLLIAMIIVPIYSSCLIKKLRASMQQARAASTAKTEFLSMISHELRTPLNAILGLAQVSKITATTTQEKENAASTEIAARRLTRMLDSILKFQAVESGAGRIRKRPFNVIDALAEVEAVVAPLAWKKKLKLQFMFRTALPEQIVSDPDLIQTIIINLVNNAIKYTKEGFVIVELACLSDQEGMKLRAEVHDSGPGIDPDMQTRIFDQFVRQVHSGTEDEGGVGLGLSLCKSLVGLIGGCIGCTSVRGQGSTFWIEIPADCAEWPAPVQSPLNEDVKIAAFGLETHSNAAIAREFSFLEECEADALLAGQTAGCVHANLVLTADPSRMAAADLESLCQFLEGGEISAPFVLVDSGNHRSSKLSGRETALVPSPSAVSPELIRTVVNWHQRHHHREGETLKASAFNEKTILVADDNTINRQVVGRMLKLDGYTVIEARTGDDALDHLLTDKIHVAILDVNMPDQDGVEICKTYQSVAARETAAVIVGLTADISQETRSRCLEAGMFDVLSKPLALEDLRTLLSRCNCNAQEIAPIPPPQFHPAEVAVLDKERVHFLTEMFGVDIFINDVLATFETETSEHIERLKADSSPLRSANIQALLHAIKSSAKSIGASRLATHVSALEDAPANCDQPVAYEGIANELNTFMIYCREEILA